MVDFRMYIMMSLVLGVVYGVGVYLGFEFLFVLLMFFVGLCGLLGMFFDLDSDFGIFVCEIVGFIVVLILMLMIDWF